MIKIKRAYEAKDTGDGKRILIDRLWPRGLKKEEAGIDEWMKDLAPSAELRKWFAHDPAKWPEFKKRYREELKGKKELLDTLKAEARQGTVTLIFAAHEEQYNNAAALREFLS